MGILIAIEGTDASGKQTQSELLYEHPLRDGYSVRLVSFPAYNEPSSALVKMYLAGEFGKGADDVNAYAASTFYAADRFATYRRDWQKDYESGTIIIADRYVPSNIIHQAAKLRDEAEKQSFIDWLHELEYKHFGLPEPSATVFLNMPAEKAAELMSQRNNKITDSAQKDIHERDSEYMRKSHENAVKIAHMLSWDEVSCVDSDDRLKSITEIHNEIFDITKRYI